MTVPSLEVMRRYTGVAGMFAYAVAVPAALAALRRWVLPVLRALLGDRAAAWLAVLTLLGLVAGFAVLFPLANSGRFGPGSDTYEAYDAAVGALVAGHDPYYPLTYLGNRIHHMPGAVFMAAPFTLLGTSAYQVLFWLGVILASIQAGGLDTDYAAYGGFWLAAGAMAFWPAATSRSRSDERR